MLEKGILSSVCIKKKFLVICLNSEKASCILSTLGKSILNSLCAQKKHLESCLRSEKALCHLSRLRKSILCLVCVTKKLLESCLRSEKRQKLASVFYWQLHHATPFCYVTSLIPRRWPKKEIFLVLALGHIAHWSGAAFRRNLFTGLLFHRHPHLLELLFCLLTRNY